MLGSACKEKDDRALSSDYSREQVITPCKGDQTEFLRDSLDDMFLLKPDLDPLNSDLRYAPRFGKKK